jgi:hypothetical protein
MFKKFIISVLIIMPLSVTAVGTAGKRLLPDGFLLAGVDGKLAGPDSNDVCFFELDSEKSDAETAVLAGASVELLRSATLEKMLADTENHPQATYRLWGKVTKYKGRNFIFPIHFLPISKEDKPQSPDAQKPQQPQPGPAINEQGDELVIPEQLVAKLQTSRIVRPQQLPKGLELKRDFILSDRTATLAGKADEPKIVLDAVGRNLPVLSYPLLACQTLEQAQAQQAGEAETLRFKIAGIVTEYKGQHYLLLQRATRLYSHENFPR